ncbi:MAG: hypothetical protein ACW99J_20690 [Candidatus Thorarchaeota archaeon]
MMYPDNMIVSKEEFQKRVLIGIPMTGLLRAEWHCAYVAQIIPCNWSQAINANIVNQYTPLKFLVADARNLVTKQLVEEGFEWLLFIDHDVVLHRQTFLIFNEYMRNAEVPIVGGLYFTKSVPAEPLIYRGRGNSYYHKWKLDSKVWCDAMGLGCHLIHSSILKILYDESEEYEIQEGVRARRVFHTPGGHQYDPELEAVLGYRGTEDLPFYDRVMKDKVLKRAGWPELQRKKYPFVCDTRIFCRHISEAGMQFPAYGEEQEFVKK